LSDVELLTITRMQTHLDLVGTGFHIHAS
jgi:hypothetical protein